MTDSESTPRTQYRLPIVRRQILAGLSAGVGAIAVGGGASTFSRPVVAQEIETCGATLDVVLLIDYSGSIRTADTWDDIRSGASDFVNALPDDAQAGVVSFGDAPKAYDFGSGDYLSAVQDGTTDNRPTITGVLPTAEPPGENGTHMPGAIDLANAILDEQGRGGKEVLVLLTDGEPNYENGVVGDGASPPADDADGTVGGVTGWVPNGTGGFDPDGDGSEETYSYDGGLTGGEDATITDSERDETAEVAAIARGDTTYEDSDGNTVSVTPSPQTRILTVGIGGADDDFLSNKVASAPGDHVATTAEEIGDALVGLLTDICAEACEVTLYAGQDIDVGTVSLSLEGETLTVTYSTTGNWTISETHLDVVESFCDFPLAGNDNPKVGQFAESGSHDVVSEVTYDVDVSGLEPPYLVATHAAVETGDSEETAWGDGCPFTERGNWATFIVFDPDDTTCGCPDGYEREQCEESERKENPGRGRGRGR